MVKEAEVAPEESPEKAGQVTVPNNPKGSLESVKVVKGKKGKEASIAFADDAALKA